MCSLNFNVFHTLLSIQWIFASKYKLQVQKLPCAHFLKGAAFFTCLFTAHLYRVLLEKCIAAALHQHSIKSSINHVANTGYGKKEYVAFFCSLQAGDNL